MSGTRAARIAALALAIFALQGCGGGAEPQPAETTQPVNCEVHPEQCQ